MAGGGTIAFFVLIAPVVVGFGAVTPFLPELDQAWTKFGNDLKGAASERGEGYAAGRILRGVLLIGMGLLLGAVGVPWAVSVERQNADFRDSATTAAPARDRERERELLLGQRVRIAYDPLVVTSSSYDERVCLWTTSDNRMFNRRMTAEAYYLASPDVRVSLYAAPYRYLADFQAVEDEARAARRGVWGDPACAVSLGTRVAEGNTPTPYTYTSPTPRVLPASRPDATPQP